jgi:membrane protein
VLSAILLFITIQGTLNKIFRVIRPRPWRQRMLVFWAVMTVGPVLLGVGASLLGYFNGRQLVDGDMAPSPDPMMILLGNFMPTLLTWMTLMIVFKTIPNRRLNMKDVMIGAAVAAVLLAVLRYGFAVYIIFMTSYQAIYGAIAAVPVFLLWLYLVWLTVLTGAVVAATLPDWRYARVGYGMGISGRMVLALEVLARLSTASRGGAGLSVEQLSKLIGAPDMVISAVFNDLRSGLFIAPTEDDRWVLCRDLERTPLSEFVHHFGLGLNLATADDDLSLSELGKRLDDYLHAAAESERTLLSVSLAQVVGRALPLA